MTARRLVVAFILLGATACGGGVDDQATTTTTNAPVVAQVASYDLAAEGPQRFLVGLLAADGGLVVGGDVALSFRYLGEVPENEESVRPPDPVTASFLPLPGSPEVSRDEPGVGEGGQGGVYEAEGVVLSSAGNWEVAVSGSSDGEPFTATAAFEVLEEHQVPVAGDAAPRTDNLLPGDPDAPVDAIDSRAAPDGTVPDPALHEITVADAIASGDPTMVVVSTPTYCVSRFCGPITDSIDQLAREGPGGVNFVHIEVWRDFEGQALNRGAAEWIYPDPSVEPAEPWVFLVDGDGQVLERWDNVASAVELTDALNAVTAP